MIEVEVKGLGIVEFPDETSPEEITLAIDQQLSSQSKPSSVQSSPFFSDPTIPEATHDTQAQAQQPWPASPPPTLAGYFWHNMKNVPAQIAQGNVAAGQKFDPGSYEDRLLYERSLFGPNRAAYELTKRNLADQVRELGIGLSPEQIATEAMKRHIGGHTEEWQKVAESPTYEIPPEYQQPKAFSEQVAAALGGSTPGMLLSAVNPYVGTAFFTQQIYGSKYKQLVDQGVDPRTAEQAAFTDSLAEMPLEYAGNIIQLKALSKVLKGGALKDYILNVLKAGGGEGLEEYLQNFPSFFSDLMAANPGKSKEELFAEFVSQLPERALSPESLRNAAVGGVAGMFLPGVGGMVSFPEQVIQNQQTREELPAAVRLEPKPISRETEAAIPEGLDLSQLSEAQRNAIQLMGWHLAGATGPMRTAKVVDVGNTTEVVGWTGGNDNPDWFKNRGWPKKTVQKAFDDLLAGKELTEYQAGIIHSLEGEIQRQADDIEQQINIPEAYVNQEGKLVDETGAVLFSKSSGVTPPGAPVPPTVLPQGQLFPLAKQMLGRHGDIPAAAKQRAIPPGPKRSQIINFMSKKLDVPLIPKLLKGKRKGIAGQYRVKDQVFGLRQANNVPTAVHEIAHHIQALLGLPAEMPPEVLDLAYEGADPAALNEEGFAEFVKYYVTEPEKVSSIAFTQTFENALSQYPDVHDVLIKAREAWKLYNAQPPVQRLASYIQSGQPKEKTTLKDIKDVVHRGYAATVDRLHAINLTAREAERLSGKKIDPENDPYVWARTHAGAPAQAENFLKNGPVRISKQGGFEQVKGTRGLLEILKPIERAGERHLLDTYLVARRAIHDPRIQEGFKGQLSLSDFKEAAQELAPKFENAAQEIYKYNNGLLDYLVDSGRVAASLAATIRQNNLFYVPFYRVIENDPRNRSLMKRKYSDLPDPIKRLKGSARDIVSPTESMIRNTFHFVSMAGRNRVGNALRGLDEIPGMGHHMVKMDARSKPIKMTLKDVIQNIEQVLKSDPSDIVLNFLEPLLQDISGLQAYNQNVKKILSLIKSGAELDAVESALEEAGLTPDDLHTALDVFTTFRPDHRTGPNEVILYNKGKPEIWRLSDDLYNAIKGLDTETLNVVVRVAGYFAKLKRAGAVLTPEFAIGRNPFRDAFSSAVLSKYWNVPGFHQVMGAMHTMPSLLGGKATEEYKRYLASGAAHGHLTSIDRNVPKEMAQAFAQRKIVHIIKHPLQALQTLNRIFEESTRVASYVQGEKVEARKNPGWSKLSQQLESGMNAREATTDFQRRGSKTGTIAHIVAFWNARLQGVDTAIRIFKRRPLTFLSRVAVTIAIPSILHWWFFHDDDRYKELMPWQKNNYWCFPFTYGDTEILLLIPKPHELGHLFGSVLTGFLDWWNDKDPQAVKDAMDTFVVGLWPGHDIAMVGPTLEVAANRDFFRNRPIVPRSLENVDPSLQYTPYTSEALILAAQKLHEAGIEVSPAQAQHMITGHGAGLARQGLDIADWITQKASDMPSDPAGHWWEYLPVVKGFFSRMPRTSTSSVEEFYNQLHDATVAHNSDRKRSGGMGGKDYDLRSLEYANKQMKYLWDRAQRIRDDVQMSPEKKRTEADQVYREIIDTAREAIGKEAMYDER